MFLFFEFRNENKKKKATLLSIILAKHKAKKNYVFSLICFFIYSLTGGYISVFTSV